MQRSDVAQRTDSVRQLVRALFAFRWTAFWFFVLFFGGLLLIGYKFPPLYLGSAKVLVKAGRETAPQSIIPISRMQSFGVPTTAETVNSEVSILLSRPVLEVVVDRLLAEQEKKPDNFLTRFQDWCRRVGLLPDIPQRENLVLSLGEKISAEPLPMTNVIEIEYLSFSDKGAWKTVDYLIDAYLQQHSKIHSNPAALAFFQGEAAHFKARLDEIDHTLTEFRVAHDGGDLSLKRSLLIQQLTTTESERAALEDIPAGAEELASASVADNPVVAESRSRLLDLRLALAAQTQQFGESARELEGLRSQIEVTKADLREQLLRLHTVLTAAEARLREELRATERERATFDPLVAEQVQVKANFDLYSQKAEEERVYQAMDADRMVSVRVIERPAMPQKPFFPNAFILALLGLVLGVPGAIAAALLRAYLVGRVATVQDVEEKLRVAVLASVAKPRPWHNAEQRAAAMGDAARLVLAALERSGGGHGKSRGERVVGERVLHVAAASAREGAASFAAALARAAADAVAERAAGATIGGATGGAIGDDRPVALVLLGERPDSRRSGAANVVELLETGNPASDTPNVTLFDLSEQRLAALPELIAQLREKSSRVIIAGTPLCGRGDGARHVRFADLSLLVLGAGHVHFEVARRAADLLKREANHFAGAVLTGRQEPVPGLVYRWI